MRPVPRELQARQVEQRQYEYSPLAQVQKWSEVESGQALFESLLEKFDADIEELMRGDPQPQGRFTRAYLRAVSGLKDRPDDSRSWTQVTIALLAEPRLRLRWRQWVQARAEEYVGTDSSLDAQIVRFAADGLWFADTLESHEISDALRRDLIGRLVDLTGK